MILGKTKRSLRRTLYLVPGVMVFLTVLAGFWLARVPVLADVVDEIYILVKSSCSVSGTVNPDHTTTLMPGNSAEGFGTTTFKVICNDSDGYGIYAIGFTDDVDGRTYMGHTTDSNYQIQTGTSGSDSYWAMKLAKVTDTSVSYEPSNMSIISPFTNYTAVPSNYTKVVNYTSSTDAGESAKGSRFTSVYKVSAAATQVAGTYVGQVKYVMVHPASNVPNEARTCAANRICYWPNGGDMTVGGVGVVDSMGDQSISSSATSATLWASNFKRAGYGFAGWSDAYDYVVGEGSATNPDAHIYGPNEDITFTAGQYSATNGGLSLYAVWVPSAGVLQNWTCPNNTNMPIGTVTALTDTRDNDTYAVAKLADGNCWMIENLRLDYDANIATSNTQSNNNAFGGVFSGLAQPETANFSNSTTANTLYKSDGSGDIAGINGATLSDIGTASNPGYRFSRYRNDNTNTNSTINSNTNVSNMTGTGQNVYSYGNYYTWAAAIADTTYYNTNNQSITTTSLCPSGWRLPQGGMAYASTGTTGVNITGNPSTFRDFYNLGYILMGGSTTAYEDTPNSGYSYYSSNTTNPNGDTATKAFRKYPNNFLYSGYASGASVSNRGSNGVYWSSTAVSSSSSYGLGLGSAGVSPGTSSSYKYYGNSIRCLVGS